MLTMSEASEDASLPDAICSSPHAGLYDAQMAEEGSFATGSRLEHHHVKLYIIIKFGYIKQFYNKYTKIIDIWRKYESFR